MRQRVPDRLGRGAQRRIVAIDQRLTDDGDHVALDASARECVLQRLLQHVPDPAGGLRDQHSERQRLRHLTGGLVAHQLVTDLRPVSMHDDDSPPLPRQLDDRRDALARVAELVGDGGRLIRARQRIATEC